MPLPGPSAPLRCPACRLLIAAGRATSVEQARATVGGTAAGVMVNAARRQDGEALDRGAVAGALRLVAQARGVQTERLRMLDYQDEVVRDPSLPALTDVLATFGGWKTAREYAARNAGAGAARAAVA